MSRTYIIFHMDGVVILALAAHEDVAASELQELFLNVLFGVSPSAFQRVLGVAFIIDGLHVPVRIFPDFSLIS